VPEIAQLRPLEAGGLRDIAPLPIEDFARTAGRMERCRNHRAEMWVGHGQQLRFVFRTLESLVARNFTLERSQSALSGVFES
jgi:hypothetical protein